jgi:UDPglucose 6-dehydrogenase
MQTLWDNGVKVQAYDPEAMQECQRIYGQREDLILVGTKEAALANADALVICTEWAQFRAPDFDLIATQLNQRLIIDGRNMYDPVVMDKKGFVYYAIGRGQSIKKL